MSGHGHPRPESGGDLPEVAVGVAEVAEVAAPLGAGRLLDDAATGSHGVAHHLVHSLARRDDGMERHSPETGTLRGDTSVLAAASHSYPSSPSTRQARRRPPKFPSQPSPPRRLGRSLTASLHLLPIRPRGLSAQPAARYRTLWRPPRALDQLPDRRGNQPAPPSVNRAGLVMLRVGRPCFLASLSAASRSGDSPDCEIPMTSAPSRRGGL